MSPPVIPYASMHDLRLITNILIFFLNLQPLALKHPLSNLEMCVCLPSVFPLQTPLNPKVVEARKYIRHYWMYCFIIS